MYQSPIYILPHNALQPPIAYPQRQIYHSPSYFSNSHYLQQSGFGNSYFVDNYSQNSGYQASRQPASGLYFQSSAPIYQEQVFQVSNPYFQNASPNYQAPNSYFSSVAPIYQQSNFQNIHPYFQSASPNYQGQIFQDSGSYFPSLGQDYSSMQSYHSSTYLINNFPSQNGFTNQAQTQQNYRVNDPYQIRLTKESKRNLDKSLHQIRLTEESKRNLDKSHQIRLTEESKENITKNDDLQTPRMSRNQFSWRESPTFIPGSPKLAFQVTPSSDAPQSTPYDGDRDYRWENFLGIENTIIPGSSKTRERSEFIQKTWDNYLKRQVDFDPKDLTDLINKYHLSGKGKFLNHRVFDQEHPSILDRVTSYELLTSQQKIPSETLSRDIRQYGFINHHEYKEVRHN